MSAYIIDDETYSNLYHYLIKSEFNCYSFPEENCEHRILHFIQDLRLANFKSVNTRYRENTIAPAWVPTKKPTQQFSSIQAFKTLHSINYQSCEFTEWPDTRAWVGLQEACNHASYEILSKTKEYSTAAWS